MQAGRLPCQGGAVFGHRLRRQCPCPILIRDTQGQKGGIAHPLKINLSGTFRRRPNKSDCDPSNYAPPAAPSDPSDLLASVSQRGWIASLFAMCFFKAPRTKQEHHHGRRNSLVPHTA